MDLPTAQEVRDWSKADFTALGYAADADLDRIIRIAARSLEKITGLSLPTLAADDEPLVEEVLKGMAEQTAYESQPEILETLSDWDLIQSFSAGPYSETRRSAEDAFKARMLNPWPWINKALWLLLTPDRLDYWMQFFGDLGYGPASAIQEVDWRAGAAGPFAAEPPMWGGDA